MTTGRGIRRKMQSLPSGIDGCFFHSALLELLSAATLAARRPGLFPSVICPLPLVTDECQ
ncbi:MAG: hypothetical protein LJE75_01865, partial [Gammaproteobacteria bacterium]|nr:hypothetical protein [Gammaproteobacteria bacterium]